MSKFDTFINQVTTKIGSQIITIIEFGSTKGEIHPQVSDIDMLVLAKDKKVIPEIVSVIRTVEKEILHTTHSQTTDYIEENYFGSEDFTGIHVIALGRNELDANFKPKSLRLKIFTTLFISQPIFVYHLKHQSKILWGENMLDHIRISQVTFRDRLAAFIPLMIFLCILPFLRLNKKQFRIWCFKILKYHVDVRMTYLKIRLHNEALSVKNLPVDQSMINLANAFRYKPSKYHHSNQKLYLKTWLFLIKNIPFLWNPATSYKQ